VRADVEREQARTADWRRRAETLTSELHEMRTRLENAQRATESANEQLMAMEVKLDLIEAAIQVLDSRTREQAVSRSL
jgi:chromosome segregation ATPase